MDLTKDSLKKILEDIRKNSVAIEGSEDAYSNAIASLDNDGRDTLQSLSVATTEAITRKKKIRSLEGEAQDNVIELDRLKEERKDDTTEVELEALRLFKSNTVKQQVKSFGTTLEAVREHPNFAKAKGLLKLPEPSEEGVFDLSKVSEEDMTHNLSKMSELNALAYFESEAGVKKKDVDGKKDVKIPAGFAERIKAAKTQEEISALQEEMQGA